MLERGSIQGIKATAKHRSHAPVARGHIEAAVQCPALSATVEVAHTTVLYQDADGTMQCFVWHKDQKAVCHCLAAILNVADDSNKDASS